MKNVDAMNKAVDTVLRTFGGKYEIRELDCGEYETLKMYGIMKFHVKKYAVMGLGNLSVMLANMGFMQMATIVLTPCEKDIPLISADYMYKFSKRTAYLEFYDTVMDKNSAAYQTLLDALRSVKERFSALEDVVPTAAWYDAIKTVGIYKNGKAVDDETLYQILTDGIGTVLEYAETLPVLTGEARTAKAALQKEYSEGLIENGGVSTDIFVKQFGKDGTRAFFDQVMFSTDAAKEA